MKLIKGDFLKSVVVLLSGTVIAQLINIIFIPIIPRLYTHEEIGAVNFYMRIVMFLTVLVTLRLEMSFPIEKHEPHRYSIFRFALRWTLILSALMFIPIIVVVASNDYAAIFNWMLVLVPLGVLLHGFFNLGMYWELGSERFKRITTAKVVQAGSTNGLKVVFGFASMGEMGLVLSVLIGIMGAILVFVKGLIKPFKEFAFVPKSKKTKFLIWKHKDLYYFNLPHVLVDLFRDLVLATFIMTTFSKYIYGAFSQSYMMLRLPILLIGATVGQVLFTTCSNYLRDKKEIWPFVRKVIVILSLISIIPFVTIFFFGTEIFSFVLGEKWADAGLYSEIITWWSLAIFITSPFSFLPVLLDRQRIYFVLNVFRTLCLIGSMYIPLYFDPNLSIESSLSIMALTQVIINAFLLLYFVVIIRQHDNKLSA